MLPLLLSSMPRRARRRSLASLGAVATLAISCALAPAAPLAAADPESAGPKSAGNRLAYLDDNDPFHIGAGFPRLTTPMWFGEPGVDAAIILSIDDLSERNVDRFAAFLPVVIERLRKIDGRAPLSIFTNRVPAADARVRAWLEAGVELDVHTTTHPCPLLGKGVDGARSEVFDCLAAIAAFPGARPSCFRMPCCDSINSASPLFFRRIAGQRGPGGEFLQADSSILVFPDESYRAYAPFPDFATTISGYPYPFVVGGLLWELPIVAPSDWQAQHRREPFHPETVADIRRAVDLVVEARGLYTWCFHPHGWIRPEQVVEVIDHAVARYGDRVRFVTPREVVERLTANFLGGEPLRAADGADNGVRVLDIDADGWLDVVIGNARARRTRIWDAGGRTWKETGFPFLIAARDAAGAAGAAGVARAAGVRFGVRGDKGRAVAIVQTADQSGLAQFDGAEWIVSRPSPLAAVEAGGAPVLTADRGRDRGLRLRDVDGDGESDLIVNNETQNAVFRWKPGAGAAIEPLTALPARGVIIDGEGNDGGLRFEDLDGDGFDDIIASNDDASFIYLFDAAARAWSRRVIHAGAGSADALPKFVSGGKDRGAWIHGGRLYVANEETTGRERLVETRDLEAMVR